MLILLLVVLLIFALFGGVGYGYPRYGFWGMSPVGVVVLIILIAVLEGWHL